MIFISTIAISCSNSRTYETAYGDPMQTRIYTLANGLKVYLTVNDEKPRIQAFVPVRVGGKNDPAETTGLSHYLEHLMFKGTKEIGTLDYGKEKPMLDQIEALFEIYRTKTDENERLAIYRQIDSISYEASKLAIPSEYRPLMDIIGGRDVNAFTGQDITCYVEDFPANQLENWAKIESERFKNFVIRGFHTELETVYEEKNMSMADDSRKISDTLFSVLFTKHPYGQQSVIGTQNHLKNPSITNVMKHFKNWYVPNNMAICLSGDFDYDHAMDVIEKYFGDMQPNDNLQPFTFEPEPEITTPIEKEVWGLDAENVTLAWRLGGAASDDALMMQIAASIMQNGKAGLIDLNLLQTQKLLYSYSYANELCDYSIFYVEGTPKEGQTLDEVKQLLLEQVDALRKGEWDESLLTASVANCKLQMQQELESNFDRAFKLALKYAYNVDWSDAANMVKRMEGITKQDVVDFANRCLKANNYVAVYKRQGEDKNYEKIAKPAITPIHINRDTTSLFSQNIKNTTVTPIEPQFVDFEEEIKRDFIGNLPLLYKKNTTNDIFILEYIFEFGSNENKALGTAKDYLSYLGTSRMSAAEIKQAFYNLACNFHITVNNNRTYIVLSGLSENMEKAMELLEEVIADAKPEQAIYDNLVTDILKSRADNKDNKEYNKYMLEQYALYGADNPSKNILSEEELRNMSPQALLQSISSLPEYEHRVLYYGPMVVEDVKNSVSKHHKTADTLKKPEKNSSFKYQETKENIVYIAPYDANQATITSISNYGEKYDVEKNPEITMYNAYFMNIAHQEIREARGLAYSTWAYMAKPGRKEESMYHTTFIETQNDKVIDALTAFDGIISNMPISEQTFETAKQNLVESLRTERATRSGVLDFYIALEDLGLTEDTRPKLYDRIQKMTLEEVVEYQKNNIKDRKKVIAILGRESDIDIASLEKWGKIIRLTTEEIFGY